MTLIVIGTRATPLARIQAALVADRLQRFGVETRVQAMSSQGDRSLGGSFAQSKGVFTGELSAALRDGTVDLVVHSLKDLPVDDEPGLVIAAVPERERPFDLLLLAPGVDALAHVPSGAAPFRASPPGRRPGKLRFDQRRQPGRDALHERAPDADRRGLASGPGSPRIGTSPLTELLEDDGEDAARRATPAGEAFAVLTTGARLGTSSPRRQAGALALRPDLVCCAVRGSVGRRLEWLRSGAIDALLAAEAGVLRLSRNAELEGYAAAIRGFRLDLKTWPCAPGQGALAVQVLRGGRLDGHPAMVHLDHPATRAAVLAERSLLGRLGGGCLRPFGAWADVCGGTTRHSPLRAIHVAIAPDDWREAAGAGDSPLAIRVAASATDGGGGGDLDALAAVRVAASAPDGDGGVDLDALAAVRVAASAPDGDGGVDLDALAARIERGLARSDAGLPAGASSPPLAAAAGENPGGATHATGEPRRAPVIRAHGRHAGAPGEGPIDVAGAGTPGAGLVRTPDLIVTSAASTVRRLTCRLDPAVRVAALPATAVDVFDIPWPADRVDLERPRRQWPWLLVSSPTAARVVTERAAREPTWGRLPWCALGEGTARALLAAGVPPNLAARAADGRGLADYVTRVLDRRCLLLVPHSARGGRSLVETLEAAGREVVAWQAYTVDPAPDLAWPGGWQAARARVLFTAPSAVAAFAASGLDWPGSCWAIGATTAAALRNAGVGNVTCTVEPTAAGIERLWNEEVNGREEAGSDLSAEASR